MAVITTSIHAETSQLRSLNIVRDLPGVADLVETCFAGTLDPEGHRYIQQMRRAGADNHFLRWAAAAVESVSMPLMGYVWEENGNIVGNASVIPFHRERRKIYLIANVAVHPDYRRNGIGRTLTVAAMHHARRRRAEAIWLHVRDDNPGAIALYLSLGFHERARRTTWQATPDRKASTDGLGITITPRYARDWSQQESWLKRLYSDELDWYQPVPWASFRPDLWSKLYRLFLDDGTRQWAVREEDKLLAALSWQPVHGHADRLWAAVPPEGCERALTALLLHARRTLTWRQALVLDFPCDQHVEAISMASFRPLRTLLWMQADETLMPDARK